RAAFVAKTKKSTIPITVKIPCCSISCTRSAICAILTVPTTEYKKAIVVTNTIEENKLIITYLSDSLNCFLRSEEHTSELQSRFDLVCRLLLEKKKHDHRSS